MGTCPKCSAQNARGDRRLGCSAAGCGEAVEVFALWQTPMHGISPTRNKARWQTRTRKTAGNLPGTSSLEIVVWEALRLNPRTSRMSPCSDIATKRTYANRALENDIRI